MRSPTKRAEKIRSPAASPLSSPTTRRRPPSARRTYTSLEVVARPPGSKAVRVVATRKAARSSSIENWFRGWPGTPPEAT